jgi:transcriptional regulator with XRE-family HTH domain
MTNMTKTSRKRGGHWTNASIEDYQSRITFDFIAQLEDRMESLPMKQKELADVLGVSSSAVSQKLNNPDNLELKTIIAYSQALGLKVALVSYDDNDPDNDNGPVNSEIFNICWEKMGKPSSFLALNTATETAMPKAKVIEGPWTTNVRWAVSRNSPKAVLEPTKKVA